MPAMIHPSAPIRSCPPHRRWSRETQAPEKREPAAAPIHRGLAEIRAYYEEAATDYLAWSEAGNMHFGLWSPSISPWDREGMLDEMTNTVMTKLSLDGAGSQRILDLGCGIGAATRHMGKRYPQHQFTGLTIVPDQQTAAEMRTRLAGCDNVDFETCDYTHTTFADASIDGAFAIESACYAPGSAKRDLIKECGRILKPGGVLVLADPMLRPQVSADGLFGRALNRWCRDFAVPEIGRVDQVVAALHEAGFQGVTVQDVSWRVLPCLMHAPPLVIKHLIQERRKGPLSEWRRRHLCACFLSAFLGLHLHKLAYYVIRAVRVDTPQPQ